MGQSLNSLGVVLDRHGNSVAAEPLLQEALDIYRESWPPGHWYTGAVANSLGHCLTALDHFQEAETVLQEANSIFRIAPQGMPPDLLGKNLRGLVDLYESWHAAEPDQGHDQQAAKWRARLTKWQASTQPATSAPDDSASEEADPSAAPNAPTNGES